jgi:hypothetical protein
MSLIRKEIKEIEQSSKTNLNNEFKGLEGKINKILEEHKNKITKKKYVFVNT